MLIATSLLTALIASATLVPAGVTESPATFPAPPVTVTVTAPRLSPSLLRYVLEEADAIWQGSGVTFVWRSAARDAPSSPRSVDGPPALPTSLRLVFGDAPGGVSHGGQLPLGWIVFDDVATPEQEIYVSYGNALRYMEAATAVVGLVDQMPTMQREMLLGRAMGRTLAHELGHYLFASKVHTPRGLMKASRTAYEFFSPDRSGFAIEARQRQAIVARLRSDTAGANQ
jgi:hypothetical protein